MHLPADASQVVTLIVKQISSVREEKKAFALILRGIGALFSCEAATVFLWQRADERLYKVKSLTPGERWDMDTVVRFFRNQRPDLGRDTIMAPIRVGDDVVGVIALSKKMGFERGAGKVLTEMLRIAGRVLGERRRTAVLEAESAIARAMIEGVKAKDIAYRTFHDLRRFVRYDHGATLVERLSHETGRVVARQVAWAKGKSDIVGADVPFAWEDLSGGSPVLVTAPAKARLWQSLSQLKEHGAPDKSSSLAGPLVLRGTCVGCVEMGSKRADFFVDRDADILSRFLPYLSWCVGNLRQNAGG